MSIPIIDTLNPLGNFPAVKAENVDVSGTALNTVLTSKTDKTYVDAQLANKANTSALTSKADKTYVDTETAKKVDKETGKGLSSNDYTNSDKLKVTILNGVLTPEMFGAVGDGSTDDTNAFAQLFAQSARKIVLGANKHYMVCVGTSNQTLVLKSGTVVDMNGSTIETTYTYTFMNYDKSTDTTVTGYSGNGNIMIYNGKFVGATMTFLHAKNIKIHNVDFENVRAKHAIQVGGCNGFEVKGCKFIGNKGVSRGALECINIEAADYTSQPYMPEGSVTYDNTTTKNVSIIDCEFAPNSANEEFNYMGDGVGTHHIPATYTYNDAGKITGSTPECEPFENITISGCKLTQRETASGASTYNILVAHWNNVFITNNVFNSKRGIRIANKFFDCKNIHIVNNVFEDVTEPVAIKSGDVTDLDVYGNIWEKQSYRCSLYTFNGRTASADYDSGYLPQGDITFRRCDGVRAVREATTTSVSLDDFFKTNTFDRFVVDIGNTEYYTSVTIDAFTRHDYVKINTAKPFVYNGNNFLLSYNAETYTFTVTGESGVSLPNIRMVYGFKL